MYFTTIKKNNNNNKKAYVVLKIKVQKLRHLSEDSG